MRLIYMGHNGRAKSFYTQIKGNNIKGYSKVIEQGDIICFDKDLQERPLPLTDVQKRNYNGVFEHPEDAINAFFSADTIPLTDDEVRSLRQDKNNSILITQQYA